jgi:translation initiation factor 3 subunit G|uniref:Eukaryotic translation initiation factor 3 subunit G n=1 Tax=Panagrolaimus sp. PS1159 TaxID=55785 RepID=A0AC35G4Q9_9BILA
MATANVELPAVNYVGSWADVAPDDVVPGRQRTEVTKDGIRTVTDYVKDEKTKVVSEVVTTYKVITKRVPRVVAERKKWKKFGQSQDDGPGPQIYTTYVAEEVKMQFTRNRSGIEEQATADSSLPGAARTVDAKAHCRICKANDHWSVHCPYKEIMAAAEEDPAPGAPQSASGRYVPPSQRDGRLPGLSERRDEYTVRVTNLPEDDDNIEEELRRQFARAGRIDRLYVARDKQTLRMKGFAFITYTSRDDAERAIEMFRGLKMGHLILKVEWTKPSNN